MNKVIIFIVAFIFGAIFIVDYFIWKPEPTESTNTISTPTPSANTIDKDKLLKTPPSLSVTGEITTIDGEVSFLPRAGTEFLDITEPQPVQQGESIATKDGTVDILFGEDISLSILEDSEVEFAQTLKDHFVLVHKNGEVTYSNETKSPLSIRSSSLIALIKNGSANFLRDNDEQTITITAIEGNVQIAYNNVDFVSQVVDLEEGETFLFYIEERDGEVL